MKRSYLAEILLVAVLFSIGCKKKKNPVYSYTFTHSGTLYTYNDVTFTSLAPAGSIYLWKFGDGATSTDATPAHAYKTSGSFDVTLIVNNDVAHATHDAVLISSTSQKMGGSYTHCKQGGLMQTEKWPINFLTFYPINPSISTYSISVLNDSVINFTDSFSHVFHATRAFYMDHSKATTGRVTFVLPGDNEYVTFAYNDSLVYYDIVTPASSGYSIEEYYLGR